MEKQGEGKVDKERGRKRENWEREGGIGSRKMTQIRRFLMQTTLNVM